MEASVRAAACEELIAAGRVTVDGQPARAGSRADPRHQRIELDGVVVVVRDDFVYYLLNKPTGVVTTANDPQGRTTVLDLVPAEPRVFPVGRLDNDTTGLLVLTNDGELTQLLTHPSNGVLKTYLAEVVGVPAPAAIVALRDGVVLDDGVTVPAEVRVVQRRGDEHRGGDRDPRRAEPSGAANVRRHRTPGGPARAHAHRAAGRSSTRAGRVACTATERGARADEATTPRPAIGETNGKSVDGGPG